MNAGEFCGNLPRTTMRLVTRPENKPDAFWLDPIVWRAYFQAWQTTRCQHSRSGVSVIITNLVHILACAFSIKVACELPHACLLLRHLRSRCGFVSKLLAGCNIVLNPLRACKCGVLLHCRNLVAEPRWTGKSNPPPHKGSLAFGKLNTWDNLLQTRCLSSYPCDMQSQCSPIHAKTMLPDPCKDNAPRSWVRAGATVASKGLLHRDCLLPSSMAYSSLINWALVPSIGL